MIIVVILAPIDLRWQWQYKIVACATFCLKVKILKQVIIKWQWQWQWQWPRYTSSILQWAIAVYHQNARMWKNCPGQRKPTVTVLSQKVELLTQLWAAPPSPLLHFREWQIIVRDDVKKYNFGFWTFPKQSCSFKQAGCKFHLMSFPCPCKMLSRSQGILTPRIRLSCCCCVTEKSHPYTMRSSSSNHHTVAWVTRPERPKGAKDEVKQARRAQSRPEGPPPRSRGPEGP